jgi:hypothetical protein
VAIPEGGPPPWTFAANTNRWTARTRPPSPSRPPATATCRTVDACLRSRRCRAVNILYLGGRNGGLMLMVVTGTRGSGRPRWVTPDVGAAGAAVKFGLKAT